MFCVLFEVRPKTDRWDEYLGLARMLKPEIEKIDGFIDNFRYRSLTREGLLLSLSSWRDEKSLVRWRVQVRHQAVQTKARAEVFGDYRLRVGQFTRDTRLPAGCELREQRLDETETGIATTATLIDGRCTPDWIRDAGAPGVARRLGLEPASAGLVAWDVFDAVLTPGDAILLLSWRDEEVARAYERSVVLPEGARLRRVRIIRDYGMFDRREATQYFPDVPR